MCALNLSPAWIQGLTTVSAAVIAVVGGILVFSRQKEYELVQRRYLDEGLDVIIATADAALSIYSHNWARSMEVLKTFRDLNYAKPDDLQHGFLDLPDNRFAFAAHYRVNTMVDSMIIWQTFQLVISFAQYGCSVAKDEIPVGLRVVLDLDPNAPREPAVDAGIHALTEVQEQSFRHHVFAQQVNRIARVVEEGKFTFRSIKDIRHHPEVKDALRTLETAYADKLDPEAAASQQTIG